MQENSTLVGGVDIGKSFLDLALAPSGQHRRVHNTAEGWSMAIAWFRAFGVTRIGMEASGGYERPLVRALREHGFEVSLHQAMQVRHFGRMFLKRAKNDKLDARLIAGFTAHYRDDRPAPDPRLQALADHLVFIDQLAEDIARLKTRLEHIHDPRIAGLVEADIAALKRRQRSERQLLEARVRQSADLARRLDLLTSIPGIGTPTALALVIGMPELGRISREQAAALIGLAPFDRDSGQHKGRRHIAGGRARPRKALCAAALPAAHRWNSQLVALYRRLKAAGKPHKLALVACARKLIVFANTVLKKDQPWTP